MAMQRTVFGAVVVLMALVAAGVGFWQVTAGPSKPKEGDAAAKVVKSAAERSLVDNFLAYREAETTEAAEREAYEKARTTSRNIVIFVLAVGVILGFVALGRAEGTGWFHTAQFLATVALVLQWVAGSWIVGLVGLCLVLGILWPLELLLD